MVNITGFTYNNNGDKMFATGDNKLIYEFNLPVNFDDASINYNNVFYDRYNIAYLYNIFYNNLDLKLHMYDLYLYQILN